MNYFKFSFACVGVEHHDKVQIYCEWNNPKISYFYDKSRTTKNLKAINI